MFYLLNNWEKTLNSSNANKMWLVVQSLSHVPLFALPWTATCQASLPFTISWSFLKLVSIGLYLLRDAELVSSVPCQIKNKSRLSKERLYLKGLRWGKDKHLKSEGKGIDFILWRGVNKATRNQVGRSEMR